jgi:hypothetical protein
MLTRTLAATITLTSLAGAQATHLVGPGGYANINAALAIAASGDVVLVQPGTYPGFQVAIGVTIRAVTTGTASIMVGSTVQATQPVHLVGLDFVALTITGSTCSLDDCRVTPHAGGGPSLNATNSRVYLNQCAVGGTGSSGVWSFTRDGLTAIGSTIRAVGSTFRGRDPDQALSGFGGGHGIQIAANSTLHGSGNSLLGGKSNSNPTVAGRALLADSTSQVWLADSTLTGGSTFSGGSQCPVDASLGRLVRCTLSPSTCAPPTIALTGALIGVERLTQPQAGAPLQVRFRAAPHEQIGVFASFALASNTFFELEQPAGLDLGSLFALDVLLADGNGVANGSWLLPPGTANQAIWLQAVTPGAVPLQLSPVTGGVVR